MIKNSVFIGLVFISLFACKKKRTEDPVPTSGVMNIKFNTLVGTSPFAFNTEYTNSSNETFKVTEFKYYLSNFSLLKHDGSELLLPNTYFLIDPSKKNSISLSNIPEGSYKGLTFWIGVDSTKSKSGANTGDLDPVNEMFWEWTGYTSLFLEGTSSSSPQSNKAFLYDIKGYTPAKYYVYQKVAQNFNSMASLEGGNTLNLTYEVNILEFFQTPTNISIAATPICDNPGETAYKISQNYVDMFKLVKVEN